MISTSIVIPTRNRRTLLPETLRSVLNQTARDYEVIVVDDGSEDDTWNYLSELQDPRIVTLRAETNIGRGATRNLGLNNARGEFVLFLDDDDLLRSHTVEALEEALKRHPNAVAAVGANVIFDARGHRRRITHPWIPRTRPVWRELMLGWTATPSRVMLRTIEVRSAGEWDPEIVSAQDTELWMRTALRGPFCLVPTIVVDKRAHAGQWRPSNREEIEQDFRERFVQGLPEELCGDAARIMQSRLIWRRANSVYKDGHARSALRLYLGVCRREPGLVLSPLTGPYLVRDVAKSLLATLLSAPLGEERYKRARLRMRRLWLKATHRDPGGERKMNMKHPS